MSEADIKHFLVTRDPKLQKTTVREFGTDYDAAQHAYQEAEQRAHGTNLDVVLLSADSLDTIKRTHSSYFDEEPNVVGAGVGGAIGGVLGAILGGPIGAALGAGAGGWLGHEIEKDTREKT
jgi:outer membrane lipoprotein SlyB